MKQEEKELLLKDLCARLPYGLKVKSEKYPFPVTILYSGNIDEVKFKENGGIENLCTIKPYLFPLSSMTEEQLYELKEITDFKYNHNTLELLEWSETHTTLEFWLEEVPQYKVIEVFDWLDKNHFDYRCLIEKGLAIDATGLNIY